MIPFNLNHIIAILTAFLVLAMSLYIWKLESENKALSVQIAGYNAVIDSNNAEMRAKANEANKTITEIKYRTQIKIEKIKEYVYDENKSECDNAIQSMRLTF